MSWCSPLRFLFMSNSIDVTFDAAAVASRHRQSETECRVAHYSRIGAYRTCTYDMDFPRMLCAQNSDDVSRIIKVITIEQAYVVTTIQA